MNKLRDLFHEARGEIVGGLVVAGVLGLLSWLSKNSDTLSQVAVNVLNFRVTLWAVLLVLGLVSGAIFFFRGYRRSQQGRQDMNNHNPAAFTSIGPYHSCFISHSSRDSDFAQKLQADLEQHGVNCWYAPKDLKIGDKMLDTFDEQVLEKDKLLLVLSEHSVSSWWIEHEVTAALDKERQAGAKVMFPVRLDDAVMQIQAGWPARIRRIHHIGDFSAWQDEVAYRESFGRLLRDLEVEDAPQG